MAVKILIKRRIPEDLREPVCDGLIRRLRKLAVVQRGYISGETLRSVDHPEECLVISTWLNAAAWSIWQANPERIEIQKQIDIILGEPTGYEMYEYI
ncbi:MAG: antibiotic biosynthesis monooxygenase [Proteobacteria bacterium]|nr:antibiotic biosynthesis monooxygenase [Pseudomonadota bacterium]MBU2226848.1 antibiotic biosynthesis monooxygenase [Pseudomonadota bacterium]MBU2261726.1 antibiotic biosynthesis monooxygenase [Pseudomonadota bacterium]